MNDERALGGRDSEHRRAERRAVKIPVQLRQRSPSYFNAEIADLSAEGFCLFYTGKLDMTAEVMLKIEGFAPMSAELRWHRGDQYGCQFINPLYPAVFDHIVQQLNDQGYRTL